MRWTATTSGVNLPADFSARCVCDFWHSSNAEAIAADKMIDLAFTTGLWPAKIPGAPRNIREGAMEFCLEWTGLAAVWPKDSSDWAAWAQAGLTVLTLIGAILVAGRRSRNERKKIEKEEQISRYHQALELHPIFVEAHQLYASLVEAVRKGPPGVERALLVRVANSNIAGRIRTAATDVRAFKLSQAQNVYFLREHSQRFESAAARLTTESDDRRLLWPAFLHGCSDKAIFGSAKSAEFLSKSMTEEMPPPNLLLVPSVDESRGAWRLRTWLVRLLQRTRPIS